MCGPQRDISGWGSVSVSSVKGTGKFAVGSEHVYVWVRGSVPSTGVGLRPWGLAYQKPATRDTGIKEQLLGRMKVWAPLLGALIFYVHKHFCTVRTPSCSVKVGRRMRALVLLVFMWVLHVSAVVCGRLLCMYMYIYIADSINYLSSIHTQTHSWRYWVTASD